MDYIAIIHKDKKSDYGVSFPDFPGCVSAGATLEEAKDNAKEALTLHIAGMKEDLEVIPQPSSLDTIMIDDDFKDGVAFLVGYTPPAKTVRVNITVAENDLAAIDSAAKKAGATRSSFLIKSALDHTDA